MDRKAWVTRAFRLEGLTLAWMVIEAGASIGAGAVAKSLLLMAFGADSVIELASAFFVLRRFRLEAVGADSSAVEEAERRTGEIAGGLLYALAACVLITSAYRLFTRAEAQESTIGLAVSVIAALGMPILARYKLQAAEALQSRSLRADAMETLTCGTMACVLLGGMVATLLFHAWWVDSVAALVLVPFLIKEAKEAISGECGCEKKE